MLSLVADLLLDTIYPSYCYSCGGYLFGNHKIIACKTCWKYSIRPFKGKRCNFCGLPLKTANAVSDTLCKNCFYTEKNRLIDKVFYFGLYDGLLKTAIHELKIKKRVKVGFYIGEEISLHLAKFLREENIDILTYVPMCFDEIEERGFEQCKVILDGTGLNYEIVTVKDFKGEKQAFLKKNERKENIKGLFSIKKEFLNYLKGKKICLFDDIYTTGNTALELVKVLKDAGASKVVVYTVARAI